MNGPLGAPVVHKVIDRHIDGVAIFERAQVFDEEFVIECIRMVEIERRDIAVVDEFRRFVIVVLWQKDKIADHFGNFSYDGGLAGAGATGYTDYFYWGHSVFVSRAGVMVKWKMECQSFLNIHHFFHEMRNG